MDMSDMDDILDNVLVKRRTQTKNHEQKTTNLNEKIYLTHSYCWGYDLSIVTKYLEYYGFDEVEIDEDGLYSGMVLPDSHSKFLWKISWISLFSGIYGITQGHYSLAPVPIGVWFNSLNYWRSPQPTSMRRWFDIAWAISGLTYQLHCAIGSQYMYEYWILMTITASFYPLGHILNNTSSWLGTFSQSMIHVGGNIANVILYSGYVPN